VPLPLPISNNVVITPLSFPIIKPDTSTAPFAQIGVDGQQVNLTALNSTTAMSRRALRDDMPGIILRTTVRAITKGVAQKKINETNPLAGLAVGISRPCWKVPIPVRGAPCRTIPGPPAPKKGEHQSACRAPSAVRWSRSPSISVIK
jgi:hypothetical protein